MSRQVTSLKSLAEARDLIQRERHSRNNEVCKYRRQIADLELRVQEHEQQKATLLAQIAEADERQDAQTEYIRQLEARVVPEQPRGILQWVRDVFALN